MTTADTVWSVALCVLLLLLFFAWLVEAFVAASIHTLMRYYCFNDRSVFKLFFYFVRKVFIYIRR